jgi:hypothetical protein
MILPVTKEVAPLFNDTNNNWRKIGKEYYQSDSKDGIVLELRHDEKGRWHWWLYDDNSSDANMAVSDGYEDTLEKALAAVYDYLDGYEALLS